MERKRLASKSIRSVGYDAERCLLEIEFATGRVYEYLGVPAAVYEWLLRTKNKGSFVTRMISPKYSFESKDAARGTPPDELAATLRSSLEMLASPASSECSSPQR